MSIPARDIPQHDPLARTPTVGSSPGMATRRLHPAEFGSMFADSSRALWCVAVGVCGDRTAAEDLVQEAAAVALTKLDEFDAATSFVAWMSQIVRFLGMNERRKLSRQREAHQRIDLIRAVAPSSLSATAPSPIAGGGAFLPEQSAFDDNVVRAVSGLDEVQRSCLMLRVVMDMPYKEIATALSIPEGTAMSHVHRAKQHVRKSLAESAAGTSRKQ
jgi:RNA polymerase sigma-70 factor (ECF subfamily)